MEALRALLALSLVVPVLGCLDALRDAPKDEATAGDLLSAARDVAAAWRPGARLSGAGTYESDNISKEVREDNATFTLPDDPAVGNGRGVFWGFEFVDPATGDQLEMGLAAHNRSVFMRAEHKARADDNSTKKTGAWAVDSDAAAGTARRNESFSRALGEAARAEWTVFFTAGGKPGPEDDGGPRWGVLAFHKDGGAIAILNATTGELLHASNLSGFDIPGFGGFELFPSKQVLYEDEESGQLTVAASTAEVKFPVSQADANAKVTLCYGRSTPAGAVSLTILGPDGKPVRESDANPTPPGPGSESWESDNLLVGQYTARLALKPGGVAADWTLTIEVYSGSSFEVNVFPEC